MRETPAGHDALLLDFADDEIPWRRALHAGWVLRAAATDGRLPDVVDVIPTAQAVLVQSRTGGGVDRLGIRRILRAERDSSSDVDAHDPEPVDIPVVYDGDDLDAVADRLGTDGAGVVAAHTGILWRVQFMGFAPGFGYLVPDDPPDDAVVQKLCAVPRRAESRTTVPVGAVAAAAGHSAVYPRSSPGGWNLLGRTDATLWDLDRDPPALLEPGRRVRFTAS